MGNFCKVANFTWYLLIYKVVTFVKILKKKACDICKDTKEEGICRNILNMGLL